MKAKKASSMRVDPAQGALFPAEPGTLEARRDAAGPGTIPSQRDAAEPGTGEVAREVSIEATLADWAERGWIRRLDAALPRFIARIGAAMPPTAWLAIALTAHMEGRGHACVAIEELVGAPERLLGWKPEALAALATVMAALPGTPGAWLDALRACTAIDADAGDTEPAPREARPFVLRGGRLYLRRYRDYECRVARQIHARAAADEAIDDARARPWLDRLFPASNPGAGGAALDWQKIACAVALQGRFSVITGGPGTGKTYTAARLLALLFAMAPDRARLRVALAAPTGKAAARLRQSIDGALGGLQARVGDALPLGELAASLGAARTLHSLLGARPDTRTFRHHAGHPLEVDVLIVDEASMVNLEMMAALLEALPPGARVVLLGDKDQLASVEAGAVLGELCRDAGRPRYTAGTARHIEALTGQAVTAIDLDEAGPALAQRIVMLRESQRFSGTIGALAQAVNAGDAVAARNLLIAGGAGPVCWMSSASPAAVVELAVGGREGAPGGYRPMLDAIRQRPRGADGAATEAWALSVLAALDRFRVLCAVRDGEWGVLDLNRAIEKRLREESLLAPLAGEWYEGRPFLVTRNDRALGVYNGDIGIALRQAPDSPLLRAWFVDGDTVRSVAVSRLADVETAFAMTVHKSQGSEFAHTVLVLPEEASLATSRELIYTGITRATTSLTVVAKSAAAWVEGIGRTARRSSGLAALLEEPVGYPANYPGAASDPMQRSNSSL